MADFEAPPLADQLCFDLYAASRAVVAAYRPVLAALGLTYPQYLVLIVLWERDTRTVREIADALRLDHGTLTPLLRRMESSDLVARQRDHNDERYVVVSLSKKGDALRKHAHQIQCDMKDAMSLEAQGFVELQETLRRLTANVSSA